MATWQFILTDLNGDLTPQGAYTFGELTNAKNRKVTLPLNRVEILSLTIPARHPLAPTAINKDCLVKAYRTGADGVKRLVFFGPIISTELSADSSGQTVNITAAGAFWRLTKRLLGIRADNGLPDKAGVSFGVGTPVDLGSVAESLLSVANGGQYTGISMGTRQATTALGTAGPWHMKPIGEAIAELSVGVNSYDFVVTPVDNGPMVAGWRQIGSLNIYSYRGVNRPDAVFEYGTGNANVISFKQATTRDGLMTRGFILAPGWPESTIQDGRKAEDASLIGSRGLYEAVVPDGGVTWDNLRQIIVDEHLRVRKNPREVITFVPAMNARPEWGTDWDVGDHVRARAAVSGTMVFDSLFRIWGVTFNVDENGNERAELELVMP